MLPGTRIDIAFLDQLDVSPDTMHSVLIIRTDQGCAINDYYKLILMSCRDRLLDGAIVASAISAVVD